MLIEKNKFKFFFFFVELQELCEIYLELFKTYKRLSGDQIFFSASNNYFKSGFSQTTSYSRVWLLTIIHTNY
jgi:hypothetical protein